MILMNNQKTGFVRGRTQLNQQNQNDRVFSFGAGTEVLVLVDGIYNDPRNKALPTAVEGDLITVAGGPYLADLVKLGLVAVPDAPEAPVAPDDDVTPEDAAAADPWALWESAGVSGNVAKALVEAKLYSKADLLAYCQEHGVETLAKIKGLTLRRAQTLAEWAAIE